MKYYVVTEDGTKYGPVDVGNLTQWASEQRILRETMLMEAETKTHVEAGHIDGNIWPTKNADFIIDRT